MEKNGEIKQKGHLYQMGHNPFRSFYAGISRRVIVGYYEKAGWQSWREFLDTFVGRRWVAKWQPGRKH
jgi:hypothetical protein